jgi:splicing factor U2AF subunit
VVSVLERKRRLTQWDLKPPGYENVTAEQAKLSGMFPLPGAPRQQAMDTTRLQAFLNQPGAQAPTTALKPSQARQSKRLFVYNIPPTATEAGMVEFFNLQLNGLNVISSSDPCLSTLMSKEKGYAMVEFRTSEDATVALALDGIEMEATDANGMSNGKQRGLQIKRPQDYIAPTPADEDTPMTDDVVSSVVPDSPNKISVTQIPTHWSDEQVTELLVTFGKLKAFVVVKDTGTEQSRGIAFAEYADAAATDIAVEGLNNMPLGDDRQLRVQRASVGSQQAAGLEMSVAAMSMLAGSSSSDLHEGRVLQMLNMVTAEELMDNDEYQGESDRSE